MTDAVNLSAARALAAGAVSSLLAKYKSLAANVQDAEINDDPIVVQDMLGHMAAIRTELESMGINMKDVVNPNTPNAPFEVISQTLT